jgi:hypothetical protein
MSRSLHARKHIAKLTALPNCSNMGGAGGFTGSAVGTSKLCHTRNRHGKRKDCVICDFGRGGKVAGFNQLFWIASGSFLQKNGQFNASSVRRTRLVQGANCYGFAFRTPCTNPGN